MASAASLRASGWSSTSCRGRRARPPRTSPRPAAELLTGRKHGGPPGGRPVVFPGSGGGPRRRSLVAVDHPSAGQVIWREHHAHPVALEHPDLELAHLAGGVGQDRVAVLQQDPVVSGREDPPDPPFPPHPPFPSPFPPLMIFSGPGARPAGGRKCHRLAEPAQPT